MIKFSAGEGRGCNGVCVCVCVFVVLVRKICEVLPHFHGVTKIKLRYCHTSISKICGANLAKYSFCYFYCKSLTPCSITSYEGGITGSDYEGYNQYFWEKMVFTYLPSDLSESRSPKKILCRRACKSLFHFFKSECSSLLPKSCYYCLHIVCKLKILLLLYYMWLAPCNPILLLFVN